MRSRKSYWIFLIMGPTFGIVLYLLIPGDFSPTFLTFFSLIPFFSLLPARRDWGWVKPHVNEGFLAEAMVMKVIFAFL